MSPHWVTQQRWSHVLFLNWKIDPKLLQARVPFELDLLDQQAVVSVVPFYMDQIRFPFVPSVPGISQLWELNLRTYVIYKGTPGIYFFSLDTGHRLGNWIAKKFFHLPYRESKIQSSVTDQNYRLHSEGLDYSLRIHAELGDPLQPSAQQHWITERYHLFLEHRNSVYRGDVVHPMWKTHSAKLIYYQGNFESQAGLAFQTPPDSAYYSPQINVRFLPFKKIKTDN